MKIFGLQIKSITADHSVATGNSNTIIGGKGKHQLAHSAGKSSNVAGSI